MATTTRTSPEPHLWLTDDPDHCALLAENANAFLIGFILDQQVTVQKAFRGPWDLRERIGTLEPAAIAATPIGELETVFADKPALHRFPSAMAKRVHEAMRIVAERYDGDSARIWLDADGDIAELERRLTEIPGLGAGKLTSIAAILTDRCNVPFDGWRANAADYGTLGDVDSPEALKAYQAKKRAIKKAARDAAKAAAAKS